MDATRCISYLTIELKGTIPVELRPAIGNRVYGCDICQEVCPWNERFSAPAIEPAYSPRAELDNPSLIDLATRLLEMSGKAFLREYRDSPVSRARRNGLLRNVCVALGNWGGGGSGASAGAGGPGPLGAGSGARTVGAGEDCGRSRRRWSRSPIAPVLW